MAGENNVEKQQQAGARLEEYLNEKHLTQTALAKMCDVILQYVNDIIRRGQRGTEDFACSMAEATDPNLHWLFTGEGPMVFGEETRTVLPEKFADSAEPRRLGRQLSRWNG